MLASLLLLCACARDTARDFAPVSRTPGVELLRRGDDYVQLIRTAEGASVRPLLARSGSSLIRRDLAAWTAELAEADATVVSVVNAQFFDAVDPVVARLAFSVKENGAVEPGYGDAAEYPGQKLVLRLDPSSYAVEPYDDRPESLRALPDRDAVVGLAPGAPSSGDGAVGRTYAGVAPDGTLVVFSSPRSTRAGAVEVLHAFGVPDDAMLLLDGGPSAQLVAREGRLVPRAEPPAAARVPSILVIRSSLLRE